MRRRRTGWLAAAVALAVLVAIGTVTASAAMVAGHGNGIEWVIDEARAKLQGAVLAGGNRVVQ